MRFRVLGGCAALWLLAACSDQAGKPDVSEPPPESSPRATAPQPPLRIPELPKTAERDRDGNRLDDAFDQQLQRATGGDATEVVTLQVILTTPVEQTQLDEFVAEGGKVRYVFRELRYGWIGSIALGKLPGLSARLRDELHFLAAPSVVVPFMDEATRSGRIRPIWAPAFAGNPAGYDGNSNITVAVLDTGVDASHTDLTGRMQGWQDYTSEAAASARDVGGHGTHVASIAVGTGAAFGAATAPLKFTQSGSLSGVPAGSFLLSTVHTPAYLGSGATLSVSTSATFLGGASTKLSVLRAADGSNVFTSFGNTSGTSPLSLSNLDGGSSAMLYQAGLQQAAAGTVSNFAVTNTLASYPSVGDGFNALRGVAPTCKWFGAKVFSDAGPGNSFDIEQALDDVVSRKVSDNIKIVNLSLGVSASGTDPLIRSTVNATVDAGLVVVVAAGNGGPLNSIGDPGRAAKVITVGATNDVNELTGYTSVGDTSPGADEDMKPDLLAPGGSSFRSGILAADSNTNDGNVTGFDDLVPNDYSSLLGTSMATPFVSGSVALMIDALQQSGTSWTFASSAQPLLMKMLLAASASELNLAREQGEGNDPGLGRAATPKDRFEGYGVINPDAAIEALVQTFVSPLNGSVSNTLPARLEWERRAWGRKLNLVNGATVILNLSVPGTADYDVYVYAGVGDAKGNPLLRASSSKAGLGTDETISFTSAATETAYMFVKRVSGFGAFSVTGSAVSHCNDGVLDAGELCDPGIAGTVCCSSTCGFVGDGTVCNDGNACTKTDSCQVGVCGGTAVACAAPDQCHTAGSCDTGTGVCSNPKKTDGASCNDANKCTQTDTCVAGTCTGASPVTCTAADQCHVVGVCDPASGACSNPAAGAGTSCNDANACTLGDACDAGSCKSNTSVSCAPPDACHVAGICQASNGQCSYAVKANGSACGLQGSCQAGSCVEPVPSEGGAGGEAGGGGVGNDGGAPAAGGVAGNGGVAGRAGAGGNAGSAGNVATGGNAGNAGTGGNAGNAGTGGNAGSSETGGSAGTAAGNAGDGAVAGSAVMSGDAGNVGATPGSAGEPAGEAVAGSASAAPTGPSTHESSGCGCQVPGSADSQAWPALGLLGVAWALGRRRRRAA